MVDEPIGEITRALEALRGGDRSAMDRLMELVYDDLRRRAHWQLLSSGGTLSTTALVHETYLRLAGASPRWEDRHHFFNVAAKAMRQILISHAREKAAGKRGSNPRRVELTDQLATVELQAEELLTVDTALRELERLDPRLAQVVELRFFGGLSMEEIAGLLAVSERTAKRDWRKAKALLHRFVTGVEPA
jgi:RNA polymerase sigma factor (TIGR02999 family)